MTLNVIEYDFILFNFITLDHQNLEMRNPSKKISTGSIFIYRMRLLITLY